MKKYLLCLVLLFLAPYQVSAFFNCDRSVEFRFGGYFPETSRLKEIYSSSWPEYQIIFNQGMCDNLQLWLEGDYTLKSGHSKGLKDPTKIRIIPISLGVKYLVSLSCFCPSTEFYLGAGVAYTFLRIKDDSEFVHEHTDKEAWGAIFKSGIYYHLTDCLFADFYVDYLYQRYSISHPDSSPYVRRNDLNAGGVKAGVGIGLRF